MSEVPMKGAVADVMERLAIYRSNRSNKYRIASVSISRENIPSVVKSLGSVEDRQSMMMPCDPLLSVNLGSEDFPQITYVSSKINKVLFGSIVHLLREFKDCFAWDYTEMPGLDRGLVEHSLPIAPEYKPVKQAPRRLPTECRQMVYEEVKKLFDA